MACPPDDLDRGQCGQCGGNFIHCNHLCKRTRDYVCGHQQRQPQHVQTSDYCRVCSAYSNRPRPTQQLHQIVTNCWPKYHFRHNHPIVGCEHVCDELYILLCAVDCRMHNLDQCRHCHHGEYWTVPKRDVLLASPCHQHLGNDARRQRGIRVIHRQSATSVICKIIPGHQCNQTKNQPQPHLGSQHTCHQLRVLHRPDNRNLHHLEKHRHRPDRSSHWPRQNKAIYWQVRAKNTIGTTLSSSTFWKFTTAP